MLSLVASVCVVMLGQHLRGIAPVELESLIAQDQHSQHRGGAKHVSSAQLVGDIKKLLVDVESNIKYRRTERKEDATHRAHKASHHGGPHLSANLDDVNHMMDGLQALAAGGGDAGPSFSSVSTPQAHRGRHTAASAKSKVGAEQRLSDKLNAMSDSGTPSVKSTKKADKKKAAILAKMKALQSQIEGDFKKVTGFGKQAGYVPPPKIPQM